MAEDAAEASAKVQQITAELGTMAEPVAQEFRELIWYDREGITAEVLYGLLGMLGERFTPIERANYYWTLSLQLDAGQGTEGLTDYELALLAWAPNDDQASSAVDSVIGNGDPNGTFLGNALVYKDRVAANGSANRGRQRILDADGWEQPGGWTGVADDVLDVVSAGVNILAKPKLTDMTPMITQRLGNPNREGSSIAGDSRLNSIMVTTRQVRRSRISSMSNTADKYRDYQETFRDSYERLATVVGVMAGGYTVLKSAPKLFPYLATAPGWQRFLNAPVVRNVVNVFRASESTMENATPYMRTMSYISYRTGTPYEKLLMRVAAKNAPYAKETGWARLGLTSGKALLGIAAIYAGESLFEQYMVTTEPEGFDRVAKERLEEQEAREGLTPEQDKELKRLAALAPDETTTTTTTMAPPTTTTTALTVDTTPDVGADAPPPTTTTTTSPLTEPVEFSISEDSPFMQRLLAAIPKVNEMASETRRRVTMASQYMEQNGGVEAPSPVSSPTGVSTPGDDAAFTSGTPEGYSIDVVNEIIMTGEIEEPNARDAFRTELEEGVMTVMENLGIDFYDPEVTGTVQEMNAADGYDGEINGWTLMRDISAPKAGREILLPPDFSALNFREYYDQWLSTKDEIKDPLIRVPEGYSAQTFQPKSLTNSWGRILGRTLTPGGENSRAAFSEDEARFITDAQTNVPDLFERGPDVEATYRESDVLDIANSMSFTQIMRFQDQAVEAGLYRGAQRPLTRGYLTQDDLTIIGEVMGQANQDGKPFWTMLRVMSTSADRYAKRPGAYEPEQPGSVGRLPYSVPTSLRSIPGPKSIAERAKSVFEKQLGRQARPDELEAIAAEITGSYQRQNQELIALDMARYDGNNAGLITGAQFKQIEDPLQAAQFNVANKWKDEINLRDRQEANATTFQRMLGATMGDRSSIANQTSASQVQQIARQ